MLAILFLFVWLFFFLFPLPLNKQEFKLFKKIDTVKEEVKRAKYSKLMICPLIKCIYSRIRSKLEGDLKSKHIVNKYMMLELSILSKIKRIKFFF